MIVRCQGSENNSQTLNRQSADLEAFSQRQQPNTNSDESVDEFDREFMQRLLNGSGPSESDCSPLLLQELFQVVLAANFLDIKPLLDLGCKTIASQIKGKTAQQMRVLLGLPNDFSPEEEEQIRRENAWAASGDLT